jgi:hypothetical protein
MDYASFISTLTIISYQQLSLFNPENIAMLIQITIRSRAAFLVFVQNCPIMSKAVQCCRLTAIQLAHTIDLVAIERAAVEKPARRDLSHGKIVFSHVPALDSGR